MQSARTTDRFGREVITWTLPSDHIVTATISNRYDGREHNGGGEVVVSINNGRLRILSFDHPYAQGAASELAIAFQNAWGTGQQSGLRAGMDRGVVCDECGAEYMDSNADHAEHCSLHPDNIFDKEERP